MSVKPIRITLTPWELAHADWVAAQHHDTATSNGQRDYSAKPYDAEHSLLINRAGCRGELVVAKATGRYWQAHIGKPDGGGDVGELGVRTRLPGAEPFLLLHDKDDDDRLFVLVTGEAPTYYVHGWCTGAEGKRPEHWRGNIKRPCYFVPAGVLHDPRFLMVSESGFERHFVAKIAPKMLSRRAAA